VVAIFEGVALQNPIAVAIGGGVAYLRVSSSEREEGHTPVHTPVNAPLTQLLRHLATDEEISEKRCRRRWPLADTHCCIYA
jgi:hypothetical protein